MSTPGYIHQHYAEEWYRGSDVERQDYLAYVGEYELADNEESMRRFLAESGWSQRAAEAYAERED